MGQRTLVYSLVLHLVPEAANSIAVDEVRIGDLHAYAAEVVSARNSGRDQPAPTAQPWRFLPDLDDLVDDLRRTLGR